MRSCKGQGPARNGACDLVKGWRLQAEFSFFTRELGRSQILALSSTQEPSDIERSRHPICSVKKMGVAVCHRMLSMCCMYLLYAGFFVD